MSWAALDVAVPRHGAARNTPTPAVGFAYNGMSARLLVTLRADLGLVKNANVIVRGVQLHPEAAPRRCLAFLSRARQESRPLPNLQHVHLAHIPAAVLVEVPGAQWQLAGFDKPGHVAIRAQQLHVITGPKSAADRYQIPLIPSVALTDFAAQGQTLLLPLVVDLRRPEDKKPIGFQHLYVILSR